MSNKWLAAGIAATMLLAHVSAGWAQTVAGAGGTTNAGTTGGTGLGTHAGTSGGASATGAQAASGGASATGGTTATGPAPAAEPTSSMAPGGAAGAQAAGLGASTVLLGVGAAVLVGAVIAISQGGHNGTPTTTGTH